MIATQVTTFDAPAVPLTAAPAAAPAYAGSGSTPGGLPYPTINDKLSQTDQYIADLADAVAVRLANPGLVVGTGVVTTDGNGQVWMEWTALATLDGLVVVPLIRNLDIYAIWPTVMQRGTNPGGWASALVRFRKCPISVYAADLAPLVGGLMVCSYAWGPPR